MMSATQVTHLELERAWRALSAGTFRDQGAAGKQVDAGGEPLPSAAAAVVFTGPVVVVAGCHGWAGTSTAALLLADAYARRGSPVRILDAAPASRSGYSAAAATEHGLDETGRWRLGSRGPVVVHRIAGTFGGLGGLLEVPPPPAVAGDTVTVVDTGWPIGDLLGGVRPHWLPHLLTQAPLLLTARANVPGLRHVEVTLEALRTQPTQTPRSTPPLVLLLGAHRRWLRAATGPPLLAAQLDGRVQLVPEHALLASAGLTPAPLPRQLNPVGDRLVQLITPTAAAGPEPAATPPAAARRAAAPRVAESLHDLTYRKGSQS
jgi:hypothetical protein